MMFWKLMFICGALTAMVQADCPLSQNPKDVVECVRYLTSGLYGAVMNDLKIVCAIASDIANCVRREMGDCVAAQVGRAAMDQVRDIAENCCPDRNHPRCPIRPAVLSEQRCFAADSLVTLANGQHTTIAQLQPDEPLLTYNDHTKRVVSTHLLTMLDFQPHRFALFKQLTTATGRQLALTSSHLLPTQEHGYLMAKHIQPGMHVLTMSADGALNAEMVSNITEVVKLGYVAPLTSEGTLLVNGVAASCYATISSHKVAHLAVLPMRWWYEMMGSSSSSSSAEGIHWFASMLYEMATFLVPSIIHH